ncbi:MAG: hypothetical protein AAGA19_10920 [Pseudomonadota bacterium]
MRVGGIVLVLGSAPQAVACADWDLSTVDDLVVINNAWNIRRDWSVLIHPDDFPADRWPKDIGPAQQIIRSEEYVPAQNTYGGFVYAGGTMAFTAGYWALAALRPRVLGFFGCDMVYPPRSPTHFYGTGRADPLRDDPTLQSLEAKSARLELFAARQGCACVNLSQEESRLVFARATHADFFAHPAPKVPELSPADRQEALADYRCASGRYWEMPEAFAPDVLASIDGLWLSAHRTHFGERAFRAPAA